MGQQQLLLIILGVIIVAIAVAIGITLFQDNAVDQNRSAVIADLTTLSAKAQQYYAKPTKFGGGGGSFVGLTANAAGLALLSATTFTNNVNGTYTIKTAGTATTVVLHGVGKTALTNGTFPTYDMSVTAQAQALTRLN
jgi:Tfp pilus assembly protein PilE